MGAIGGEKGNHSKWKENCSFIYTTTVGLKQI